MHFETTSRECHLSDASNSRPFNTSYFGGGSGHMDSLGNTGSSLTHNVGAATSTC